MALPSGYTQLEYIQSTGTQYFKTGFVADSNTRIVMDFEILNKNGDTALTAFGARTAYSSKNNSFIYDLNNVRWTYNYGTTHVHYNTDNPVGRHLIDANMESCLFNDISLGHSANTFDCEYEMYLFALNSAGTATWMPHGRLYSCRIYDNGTLVRDFVPAMRDADRTVGLYDSVNDVFYTNAGSGTFSYRSQGAVLPSGYTQLEYIQANGAQYIDLGIKPTNNTRVVFEVRDYPYTKTSNALFGSRASGSSSDMYLFTAVGSAYRSDFYNNNVNITVTVGASEQFTIDKNKNVTTVKTGSAANTNGSFSGSYNLYLFALNSGGTAAAFCDGVKGLSCEVYENGVLVRDCVPALRESDRVAGLYDLQNGVFYTNAGTGVFTYPGYGTPVGDHNALIGGTAYEISGGTALIGGAAYEIANGKTLIGGTVYDILFGPQYDGKSLNYIRSNGGQYFNTGYKPNNNTRVVMNCALRSYTNIPTLFGAWNAANSNMFVWCGTGTQWWLMYAGDIAYVPWNSNWFGQTVYDANKNVWSFGGSVKNTFTARTFSVAYPLFLFAYNNAGKAANHTSMDLYSCQIYDNGTLVRDYVPWQSSAGVNGLLDLVSGTFAGSANTNAFIAG